jgi:hypothetical protein
MSKHAKSSIVTKVLGFATVAVISGAAVATLLPSADFSGPNKVTGADVVQSVEAMVNPAPVAVTRSVVPVKHSPVSSKAPTTSTSTSTAATTSSAITTSSKKTVVPH